MSAEAETSRSTSSVLEPTKSRSAITHASTWLTAHLAKSSASPVRLSVICAAIFLTALGVRLLYWQDSAPELSLYDTLSRNMAVQYRREARRILEDGTILFPRKPAE